MIYTLYQYLSSKIKNFLKKIENEYIPNYIDTNNIKINMNV